MELKENLTTENVRKKFDNQFELVAYAISLARNMIETGRDVRVKVDSENPALRVLAEIAAGKDYFEEVVIQASVEVKESVVKEKNSDTLSSKPTEKKKNRKILVEAQQ